MPARGNVVYFSAISAARGNVVRILRLRARKCCYNSRILDCARENVVRILPVDCARENVIRILDYCARGNVVRLPVFDGASSIFPDRSYYII